MTVPLHSLIETNEFINDCEGIHRDEVEAMMDAIAADPKQGVPIPGTGGALKRRFAGRGKGKSGGYRVVSFYAGDDVPVLLLALINKGERADLSQAQRNELKKELAGYASDYRAGARKGKRS